MIWWDEKNVYLTHKMITLKDNIIRAITFARASCLKVNVHELAEIISPGVVRPDIQTVPLDYRKWMETLELSSQLMKAKIGEGGADGCSSKDTSAMIITEEDNCDSSNLICKTPVDQYSKIAPISVHQD